MRFRKSLLFVLSFLLIGAGAFAQISFKGQYIPRSELRHGFKSLAAKDQDVAFFTSQRTRLILGYTNPRYKFGVAVQDIRTWGSVSQLNISDGFLSIHEAWGEVSLKEGVSVKIGRQELIYDDHRILGNVDWAMQGRSHDVGLLKIASGETKVHIGLGFNQDREQLNTHLYTVPGNYKTMQFLWVNQNFGARNNTSFLFLNNGVETATAPASGKAKFSQTIGARSVFKGNALNLNAAFYYQMGKIGSQDLSAYNLAVDVVYKTGQLQFSPGFEILSGTSQTDPSATEINSFNPFYGTNHKFNGFMDYFFVGNHINNAGLKDIFFKMDYKTERNKLALHAHFFLSDSDIIDSGEFAATGNIVAVDSYLGTEIDITSTYTISPDMSLQLGYSQMFGTDSMVELKGGDTGATSNWAYVMLKLKPDFLSKEPN